MPASPHLVSTEWLAAHLTAPDVVVADASWHMPAAGRNALTEYLDAHIPGAVFFDIDAVSDPDTDLPHMLPSPHAFSSAMRKLGIGDGMRVVVYDATGLYSAPRAWWMLRVMGARDVAVLDGGLPKWRAEGRPVEMGAERRSERHFTARRDADLVRDLDDMRAAARGGVQIVDARSAKRFSGAAEEPRAGLRAGHIPHSRNLPYTALIEEDGRLRPPAAILEAFETAGIDPARPVVTTCGSGVTAAILSLGLAVIGRERNALYDGSWAEWGGRDDTDIETG